MSMQNEGSESARGGRFRSVAQDGVDNLLADAIRRAKDLIREHGLDGLPPESASRESHGGQAD